LSYTPA